MTESRDHGMLGVEVDRVRCAGSGLCESVAPDVFTVGDDGKAHVVADPEHLEELVEDINLAVVACPQDAIFKS